MIRKGGVPDVRWFWARLEIKCLISIQSFVIMISAISQLRLVRSHNTGLRAVAHSALELDWFQIRKCHFLSDP